MSHGDKDHGLARCGVALVVLAVPPVAPQPAEGPLHDPALRQHHKPFDFRRPQHRLQQPPERAFDAFRQVVPAVGAVGEDDFQPPLLCLQPAEDSQGQHDPVVVLNVRRMDHDREDQPERTDDDMDGACAH